MFRRTASLALAALAAVTSVSHVARAQDGVAARVGPDTGYALAIDFSGDLDGNLENCGCHHHPMGGLVWRAGYVSGYAKLMGDKAPLLQVDAGHSLSSNAGPNGLSDESRVRNDYMLRAFASIGIAAANVSFRDAPYLSERMRAGVYQKSLAEFPVLANYVSANLVPADATVRPFAPYVVREVKGARLGSKPVRVAFVGVTDVPKGADGKPVERLGVYRVVDPVEAAREAVAEARSKADVVVLLVYADRDTARRVGLGTQGVDLILAARQFPLFPAVDEAGGAVIAYVSSETKWLSEVRLWTPATPGPYAFSHYEHRDVGLDNAIPDDAAAVKLLEASRVDIAKVRPPSTAVPTPDAPQPAPTTSN